MAEKIILDTNIFISVINEEPTSEASKKLLDKIDQGELKALVSAITLAELATGYCRVGDEKGWKKTLQHIVSSENYSVIDLDYRVADEAGRIAAESGLKLPDAVIVASGIAGRASKLVTYDKEIGKTITYIECLSPTQI